MGNTPTMPISSKYSSIFSFKNKNKALNDLSYSLCRSPGGRGGVVVKLSSKTMWNCVEKHLVFIFRTRATINVFKSPFLAWYFLIFTPNVAYFDVAISLKSLLEYPNPRLTGIPQSG